VNSPLLRDFGERRLIEEVLRPRYQNSEGPFGDDCASLTVPLGHRLIVTTDPCPPPMAAILGYDDLYYRGWLLATINLSDLAAAGATPLGIVTSLVLPPDLSVESFTRLLDGIDACCAANGTCVIGGNLKEGTQIDVQATAFGAVPELPLSRFGGRPGDLLAAVGPAGTFWAGTLSQIEQTLVGEALDRLLEPVLIPRPQLAFGQALLASGIPAAVMDNSDGLGPTVTTLAQTNDVGLTIDLTDIVLSDDIQVAASQLGVDGARFLFGWGDWNVVVSVAPGRFDEVCALAAELNVPVTRLGELTVDRSYRLRRGDREVTLEAPDSQRFAPDSWFTAGIEEYIRQLRTFPMP